MTRRCAIVIVRAWLVTLLIVAPAAASSQSLPFQHALLAPPDISFYLHVEQPGELRRQLADRPIADAIDSPLVAESILAVWRTVAASAQRDPGVLFDQLFRRQLTLLTRDGAADGPVQWALITRMDVETRRLLDDLMKRQSSLPRQDRPVITFPEHDIMLAADGDTVIIGPLAGDELFDDVLERSTRDDLALPTLATHPALRRLDPASTRDAGPGVSMLMRHAEPLGGWSIVHAELNGEEIALTHRGSYDVPPTTRPPTKTTWDAGPLHGFRGRGLVAMMEPTDTGSGQIATYLASLLGRRTLIDGLLAEHAGPRRILLVDEFDGRQDPALPDMLVPTFALAIQTDSPKLAALYVDEYMSDLVTDINRHAAGSFSLEFNPPASRRGAPRHIDLDPMVARIGFAPGEMPIVHALSLNWQVVDGATGTWWVIASHPQQLAEVQRVLADDALVEQRAERWDAVGTLNGTRLGMHLATYIQHAPRLAADDPHAQADFRLIMQWLSDVMHGIEQGDWTVRRPSPTQLNLDATLTLAPRRSSRR